MFQRSMYIEYLRELREELQTASVTGEKECRKCGYCCAMRPCIPTPDELRLIAEFLGKPVKQTVQEYFVGDRLGGGSDYIFPAKHTQTTGEYLSASQTWDEGYCIFFDEGTRLCIIYEVRPRTAREHMCWSPPDMDDPVALAVESWRGEDVENWGVRRGWDDD